MNAYRALTQGEFEEILEKHRLWLKGKPGGARADLAGTRLVSANLTRADLSRANLSYADFSMGGKPRLYTPSKTTDYEEALRWAARAAMAGKAPLQGPLSAHIRAALPVPASWSARQRAEALAGKILPQTRPDADNLAKAILDAGNRILYEDDRQIARLCVEKFYAPDPDVTLALAPCPNFEDAR